MTSARSARRLSSWHRDETRFAWALAAPALAVIGVMAVFPIVWTFWESLHLHDLRMPWLGRPFIGTANYQEVWHDGRFWSALSRSAVFVVCSVTLELVGGLALALALDRVARGRGLVRTAVLLPWRFRGSSPRSCGASCSRARPAWPAPS